jgi:proline iminopeptidase
MNRRNLIATTAAAVAMDPADMKKMASLMPNAKYAFCPNGSHLCMWDDQEV